MCLGSKFQCSVAEDVEESSSCIGHRRCEEEEAERRVEAETDAASASIPEPPEAPRLFLLEMRGSLKGRQFFLPASFRDFSLWSATSVADSMARMFTLRSSTEQRKGREERSGDKTHIFQLSPLLTTFPAVYSSED